MVRRRKDSEHRLPLTPTRIAGVLPLSCSVWEILLIETFREKSKPAIDSLLGLQLLLHSADASSGRVQGQQCQATPCYEAGGRGRSLLRVRDFR
jgi:hypothetical protein